MLEIMEISEKQIIGIGEVLNCEERPLKERFRALFTLKNIGGPASIECIRRCFADPSALLKHELAYCLGQMQDKGAIETLVKVLKDVRQEPMVRHEAAEALGAIGSHESLAILETFLNDPVVEVAETCQLALERIKYLQDPDEGENVSKNPYASVDPAPPFPTRNAAKLATILLNEEAGLFERYRAMFALRNLGSMEAIEALCSALKGGSALYRHEVAFVLGQMRHEASVPALCGSLEDETENEMVRHECAEALGAIASPDCYDILKKFLNDEKRVVRESCEIALDMCEYENSPEFQYANALK